MSYLKEEAKRSGLHFVANMLYMAANGLFGAAMLIREPPDVFRDDSVVICSIYRGINNGLKSVSRALAPSRTGL
jgi:hypothetical protein